VRTGKPINLITRYGSSLAKRRPGKNCSPREDAVRRLGLEIVPETNPLAVRAVRAVGSKSVFIDYARLSNDEQVQWLVGKWDGLSPSDREALCISDLCAATGLRFSTLLGEVTARAFDHNSDVSRLIAAVNQPRVVEATVRSAIRIGPDGTKDRQMLLAHSNFLPVPKSASTIFHMQQQINNAGEELTRLPSFSEDVIMLTAADRGKLSPTIGDAESRGGKTLIAHRMGDHGREQRPPS
jgi:hypothetical protein